MSPISSQILIESLRSTHCPFCGGTKKPAQTLCWRDYSTLPANAQIALYQRVGHGYAEAVAAAMKIMGIKTFQLPPAARGGKEAGHV